MDILDGRDFCPVCLGCGVIIVHEEEGRLGRCLSCRRFPTDAEAVVAAEELVRATYANHRRALDLGAGSASILIMKCADCPCHFIHIDDRGEHNEQRCNLLNSELFHDVDEDVAPDCPLKKFSMTLRSPR